MNYSAITKEYLFNDKSIRLQIPDKVSVESQYAAQKNIFPNAPFPYWARLWPSAIALSHFLVDHPEIVAGKKVLELAAGLGLPSLVAAHFAQHVLSTDYNKDAMHFIQQSAALNNLNNIKTAVIDWNVLPQNLSADVLLLSDIAYDPAAFETLYILIQNFLEKGAVVLVSTPQRLMAKPFAARLLPFCIQTETKEIDEILISLFVLKDQIIKQ